MLAFAHEAGIHQDGMLKHASTFEIMTPEDIGLSQSKLVLGKHSGRHLPPSFRAARRVIEQSREVATVWGLKHWRNRTPFRSGFPGSPGTRPGSTATVGVNPQSEVC